MNILVFVVAGFASWFNIDVNLYGSDARVCAMNVLPPGTRITIVRDDNGRESDCVVIGTGPFKPGRVLDASPAVAADLGYVDAGVVRVRVYRRVGRMKPCKTIPQPQTCAAPPPAPCELPLPHPAIVVCK